MSAPRSAHGVVVLPPDAAEAVAGLVVVEIRDVSLMDVPSEVLAESRQHEVPIGPGERIPFEVGAPEAEPGHSLSLRAHVNLDGSGIVSRGDSLTVTVIPVPPVGEVPPLEVPVVVI
jgi:putative lipoprotein